MGDDADGYISKAFHGLAQRPQHENSAYIQHFCIFSEMRMRRFQQNQWHRSPSITVLYAVRRERFTQQSRHLPINRNMMGLAESNERFVLNGHNLSKVQGCKTSLACHSQACLIMNNQTCCLLTQPFLPQRQHFERKKIIILMGMMRRFAPEPSLSSPADKQALKQSATETPSDRTEMFSPWQIVLLNEDEI